MDNGVDAVVFCCAAQPRFHIRPEGVHALAVLREPVHHIGMVGSDAFPIAFAVAEDVLLGQAVLLAKVSTKCAEYNANVIEVTQSVLQDLFAMIMLVDITKLNSDFATMADGLTELGQTMGVKIHTMHEDIFNCMHHI